MSFPFFAYPHTDLNQPNLDWIIRKIKELERKVDDDHDDTHDDDNCTVYAPLLSRSVQCACTVIRQGNFVAIIDLGGVGLGNDVLTYLGGIGVDHLDACIISHFHADHIGDYQTILNGIDTSNCVFYLPPPLNASLIIQGSYTYDYKGAEVAFTTFVRDTLGCKIVYPINNTVTEFNEHLKCRFLNCDPIAWETNGLYTTLVDGTDYTNFNNFSMVNEFIHDDVVITLTGDLQWKGQRLVAGYMDNPTVYMMPHHANNVAADSTYISRLNPGIVFIEGLSTSTVYFTNTELIHYVKHGVPAYSTSISNSAIVIESDGTTAQIVAGSNGYINYNALNVWVRSGQGDLNTDTWASSGYARWWRYGNLVYVMVQCQVSTALPDQSNVYQNIVVATNLPQAAVLQRTGVVSNHRGNVMDVLNCYARIDTSGTLFISTQGALPVANTTFSFGFVYIAND